MACSLFGISNDVAMQMVGVGFIIGVIQDSVETVSYTHLDVYKRQALLRSPSCEELGTNVCNDIRQHLPQFQAPNNFAAFSSNCCLLYTSRCV